jgi:hypothetical protein
MKRLELVVLFLEIDVEPIPRIHRVFIEKNSLVN